MPTDAKLGLLAGMIGVVVVAVMSVNRPPTVPHAAVNAPGSPTVTAKPTDSAPAPRTKPAALAARPTDPPSTPIARTRREPDGRPTSRTPMDDIDP